jgi:hypothetical protein
LEWFKRAKDGDADLAIAKMYLDEDHLTKAVRYLKRVCKAKVVTEASKEEARRLLERLV